MKESLHLIESQQFLRERLEAINPLLHPLQLKDWIPGYTDFEPWNPKSSLLWINQNSRNKIESLLQCCDAFLLPFSGLTAGGKDTVRRLVVDAYPNLVNKPQTVTTRNWMPRDIVDYYQHLSREEFEDLIYHDRLVEYTEQYGHYYGLPKNNFLTAITETRSGLKGPIIMTQTEISSWKEIVRFLDRQAEDLPVLTIFTLPQLPFQSYTGEWLATQRESDYQLRVYRAIYELITAAQEADLLLLNPFDIKQPGRQAFQTLNAFFSELLPKHLHNPHLSASST